MNDTLNEQVSAAVDGELAKTEAELLLRRLATDPELAQRWEHYHLIREALHNQLPPRMPADLSERVRNAVEREPAPHGTSLPQALFKPLAGFAIAASVAALAVLGARGLHHEDSPLTAGAPLAQAPVAVTPAPAAAQLANAQVRVAPVAPTRVISSSGTRWELDQPEVAARLNDYLLSHRGHSEQGGMQGVLPYARIVDYDNGE